MSAGVPDINDALEHALELYLKEFGPEGYRAEDFVSYCCQWLERRSDVDPMNPERQALRQAIGLVCKDIYESRERMKIATFPEGWRMCVRRPAKPELAVRLAKAALGSDDPTAIERIAALCGPYTFVGYVAADDNGRNIVLDAEGRPIGKLKPGDSITDEGD